MDFGVFCFPTDETVLPGPLALAVEQRGFDCLMFPEHTHIPSSRATPYPGGGDLPRPYYRTLDPFVALTAAAAATTALQVGTGICLVVERDPIITAKEVATLDLLSGGRVLFGVGVGWNREEMANHGTDPRRRVAVADERIQAMRAIWTSDEAEFHGEHVDFDPIFCWPKPLQQPHPPILVGGDAASTLPRVVSYGDVWMPNPRGEPEALAPRIAELQRLAEDAGRPPIPVWIFGVRASSEWVERYAAIGVSRCIFALSAGDEAKVLDTLDARADVAAAFRS